ncbi:glycosyltransferase [Ornithinimicrobium sp. W1679]|uniref:glycosyltransferase n=1 Tax=unclassified Ornithinimicrobium TaxID=2615080 RepID=UPI003CFA3B2E
MAERPGPSTSRLPLVDGRPARVVSLVYNDASTDSRVQKTAATLRAAGAEAVVVAISREVVGHLPGRGTVGDGVPVHRVHDLDLTRLLPRTTRAWRRLRGRNPDGSPRSAAAPPPSVAAVQPAAAVGPSTPGEAPPPPPVPDPPPAVSPPLDPATATSSSPVRAVAGDLWMRFYQTVRLGHWWYGVVRASRELRPDVVHANDANTLVPALLTTVGTPGLVVYDSHELWRRRNTRQDRWLAPAVDAVVETVGARLAAGVITVSPSIAAWLQRHYRLADTPTLVRNVPTARPTPSPEEGRLRELAGLGPADRVVSYTGSITTGRGLEETVEALALLEEDVHLVLLGYGAPQYVTRLLRQARAAGVAHRMHLVGSVPSAQVPQTLADADVAVVYVRPICLSYLYSLPNKLFESIHAGLPIVAADLPDTAEVVRRHGVGEVFDARTPADLAAAIRAVLADPGHYRRAAVTAARELTWEHEAERMIALYARVLSARSGG